MHLVGRGLASYVYAARTRELRIRGEDSRVTYTRRGLASYGRGWSLSLASEHARAARVLACARLLTRESHARSCYLTCDLYCTLLRQHNFDRQRKCYFLREYGSKVEYSGMVNNQVAGEQLFEV